MTERKRVLGEDGEPSIWLEKEMIWNGVVLIEGLPSVGIVSSIASNFLVEHLNLEYLGFMDIPGVKQGSLVMDGKPYPPVRIYGGTPVCDMQQNCDQVVLLTSEFPMPADQLKAISKLLMEWHRREGFNLLLSLEAVPVSVEEKLEKEEQEVFYVGGSSKANEIADMHGLKPIGNGFIKGITGILLNESRYEKVDHLCLLTEATEQFPDARAAGALIHGVNKVITRIEIDSKPLFDQADVIEKLIRQKLEMSVEKLPPEVAAPSTPGYLYG